MKTKFCLFDIHLIGRLANCKYTFAFGVQDKQKRILKLFQKYCSDPSQNRDNLDMTFVNRRIQYSDQMLLECQPQYRGPPTTRVTSN